MTTRWTWSCLAVVVLACSVARAEEPPRPKDYKLSGDMTLAQITKQVAKQLKKMTGTKIAVTLSDSKGPKGKCSNSDMYDPKHFAERFAEVLRQIDNMTSDAEGKARVGKLLKRIDFTCYPGNNAESDGYQPLSFKDGVWRIVGNPQFITFFGIHRRFLYVGGKEPLAETKSWDSYQGTVIDPIYDDRSLGESLSYIRAKKYARDVVLPFYKKKLAALAGGPIELEIDYDLGECRIANGVSRGTCGNTEGQGDSSIESLIEDGIPGTVKAFAEVLKTDAQKKLVRGAVKKIRFSWRKLGDQEGSSRVDMTLADGVLTLRPDHHTYLTDRGKVTEFLKKKISGLGD